MRVAAAAAAAAVAAAALLCLRAPVARGVLLHPAALPWLEKGCRRQHGNALRRCSAGYLEQQGPMPTSALGTAVPRRAYSITQSISSFTVKHSDVFRMRGTLVPLAEAP